jgi:thioredoxin reductase (NADPH)
VERVERDGGGLRVQARTREGERSYGAKRVVLAIGDMHGARMLGIPGEGFGHVSHYLREPHAYFRRRVVIIGGRNSAVEAAIRLWRVGAEVTISYRRERFDSERIKYWLLPEIEGLIRKGKIGWRPMTEAVEITGTAARLQSIGDGREELVEADDVLALTGYVQDPALFRACGIELVGESLAPAHNPATMETNVPGIYVAGTAMAGTQSRFKVFIETSHVHVERIVWAITGRPVRPMAAASPIADPES